MHSIKPGRLPPRRFRLCKELRSLWFAITRHTLASAMAHASWCKTRANNSWPWPFSQTRSAAARFTCPAFVATRRKTRNCRSQCANTNFPCTWRGPRQSIKSINFAHGHLYCAMSRGKRAEHDQSCSNEYEQDQHCMKDEKKTTAPRERSTLWTACSSTTFTTRLSWRTKRRATNYQWKPRHRPTKEAIFKTMTNNGNKTPGTSASPKPTTTSNRRERRRKIRRGCSLRGRAPTAWNDRGDNARRQNRVGVERGRRRKYDGRRPATNSLTPQAIGAPRLRRWKWNAPQPKHNENEYRRTSTKPWTPQAIGPTRLKRWKWNGTPQAKQNNNEWGLIKQVKTHMKTLPKRNWKKKCGQNATQSAHQQWNASV